MHIIIFSAYKKNICKIIKSFRDFMNYIMISFSYQIYINIYKFIILLSNHAKSLKTT